MSLDPGADAGQQRAIAERDEDGVDRRPAPRQLARDLQRDGPRAFGDRGFRAVLGEQAASVRRMAPRRALRRVEILAVEDHLRAEPAHRLDLQRVGVDGGEDRQALPGPSRRIGQALSEIARRGGDQRRVAPGPREEPVSAAPLEAPDRIERLDLREQPARQRGIGGRMGDQGGVAERRIDGFGGGGDPLERRRRTCGNHADILRKSRRISLRFRSISSGMAMIRNRHARRHIDTGLVPSLV
jgi:hypothetical protein